MFFLILIFSKARKKRAVSHKSSTATLSVKAHCRGLCFSLFLFSNELPGLLMLTKRKKKGFFCLHFGSWKKSKQPRANSGKTLLSASPHMSGITVGVHLSTRPIKDPTVINMPHRRPMHKSFEDMVRTSLSRRTSQMPVWSVSADLRDKQPTTYFHVCSFEISS